ncbi:MAG: hypothetical protein J6A21_06835 [Lentisphaeria bacterium]|nr:hypothetical protein [Lentisphaeria bacterium]
MKKLFLLCVCLLTASLLPLQAKELVLAGKTVAPATIFIPKEPSPVIRHAAPNSPARSSPGDKKI